MTRTMRARQSADREAAIIAVAARLFRHRGYAGVGIDDIGEALGITGPALYRYFSNKQSLLQAVLEDYADSVESERERQATRVGTERGAHIVEALLTAGFDKGDALVVFLRQVRHLDEPARTEMTGRLRALERAWEQIVPASSRDREGRIQGVQCRAIAGVVIHLSLTKHLSAAARRTLARTRIGVILETDLGDGSPPSDAPRRSGPVLLARTRSEAILQVATRQFRERGYNGVSLREIGQELGIGASAVSRHFDTKEQILAAAFNRGAAQIMGGIIAAINRSSTAEDAAADIICTYARTAMECRDLIAISATERYFLPDTDSRRRHQSTYVVELAHMLEQAVPGLSRAQARARAGCVYSVVNEVIMSDRHFRRPALHHELCQLGLAIAGLPPRS